VTPVTVRPTSLRTLTAAGVVLVLTACGGGDVAGPPPAPTSVRTSAGPGYVDVEWDHDGQNVVGFAITRQEASGATTSGPDAAVRPHQAAIEVGPDARSHRDHEVSVGTDYRYAVAAMGAAGTLSTATEQAGPAIGPEPPLEVSVTWVTGSVGAQTEFAEAVAAHYMAAGPHVIGGAAYDVTVEVLAGPASSGERLDYYLEVFGAASPELDIVEIDVVWPGDLAAHLIDLAGLEGVDEDVALHFPSIVENNAVAGGLVALPYFVDVGILYYRSDLVAAYGFDGPPATWDELEAMATAIQEGERDGGNGDFWGYVWQGAAYEGLTVNALEWVASHGGGHVVEPDGVITIDNPLAVAAVERAAGWVDTISPEDVTTFHEESSRSVWQAGNAAFMRNWPYAYGLGQSPASPIAGLFGVAPVPGGDGGGPAATLGGWQLAVSAYSEAHEVAAHLALFITSYDNQRDRAIELGMLPTRMAVYDDPALLGSDMAWLAGLLPVLEASVARPSTVTAPHYAQVSQLFSGAVHDVLTGANSGGDALAALSDELVELLGFPVATAASRRD
jgi:trehalose/maltose transport system substrate-binding protein